MFKNLLKTAIRNILKHKTYTLINIFGLAIGLTCAILILLWVQDELSIDNYQKNRDHICQAYLKGTQEDQISFQSTTSPAIATILGSEYPEIKETVRIGGLGEVVLKAGNTRILETGGIAADPSVWSVFSYAFIHGDPNVSLENPYSIILSESTARKYFGKTDVLGQVLRLDDQFDLQVTGVIQDLPQNTYRSFDFVVPFVFLKNLGQDIEGSPFFPCSYLTYALLELEVDYENLSEKIQNRIFSRGDIMSFEIVLMPFKDTYMFDTGGRIKIMALGLIALMILGIACINFMNLATARSTLRAKEIGIRKVTGADKSLIARQFLGEALFLTGLATVLAIILTDLILRYFNDMTGKNLALNFSSPGFVLSLIGLILITGLLAGTYPAIFLSRFDPVKILKQKALASRRATLRKVLIVTQFVFSIIFIVTTVIMSRQLQYVQNFNLGVNEDNVIYVRLEGDIQDKYLPLKQELLQNPRIAQVTTASTLPTAIRTGSYFSWGKNDDVGRRICETRVSFDYLETFEIEMAEGRFFSDAFPNDANESIVINETALRTVELTDPVGKPFYYGDRYYTLIGVVKDFQHNKTLTRPPDPLSFFLRPEGNELLFVKINPNLIDARTITEVVSFIRQTCDRFSPERPLNYQFLNEFSFEFEQTMELVRKIILYSTIMAIVVSCLGLFGLSAFLNEQKTKENGIRKVLGASIPGLIVKSSREFLQWVLLATVIATPIAWLGLQQFLQNFAYRISMNLWIFLFSGGIALGIALITVSYHAVKAATSNPIDAIRYE